MSFRPKLANDYVAFIDGSDTVKYFEENATYVPPPTIIHESFKFHFKKFIKSGNNYFVGIDSHTLVRPIQAASFKLVKALAEKELQHSFVNQKPIQQGFPQLD